MILIIISAVLSLFFSFVCIYSLVLLIDVEKFIDFRHKFDKQTKTSISDETLYSMIKRVMWANLILVIIMVIVVIVAFVINHNTVNI